MRESRRNESSFGRLASTLFFVLLLTYFSYHSVSGDRGLLAMIKLVNQIEKSRAELDLVEATRIDIGHRVSLLKDESLDLDLLEEQARKILGYAKTGESVYFLE